MLDKQSPLSHRQMSGMQISITIWNQKDFYKLKKIFCSKINLPLDIEPLENICIQH